MIRKKKVKKSKVGAPRKWSYRGTKKNTSVRLSDNERKKIAEYFPTVQAMVQFSVDNIELLDAIRKERG